MDSKNNLNFKDKIHLAKRNLNKFKYAEKVTKISKIINPIKSIYHDTSSIN